MFWKIILDLKIFFVKDGAIGNQNFKAKIFKIGF